MNRRVSACLQGAGAYWPDGQFRGRITPVPNQGTASDAMRRMASGDPELAARMILHSMPAAAAALPEGLSYRLELDGLGAWRVIARGDRAEVIETPTGGELNGDAFAIETDPATL
ncbi:MAG: hypothetical protein H0V15_01025, partial [Solirubrobacterales bacterium]|nr:hypothetical protein [Solirubrobacterales bacterium]